MTAFRPLPGGWRWATLGEVCVEDRVGISGDDPEYSGLPYLGLEHIEPDTGRVMVSEDEARLSTSKSNNFRFTRQHVLYGKLRPYLNKVALPDFEGRCSTEIIPLFPVAADREWLAWWLRREETVEYAMGGKTGSRMPRAAMRDLLQLSLALPPLAEQRRIVADLERQMAAAGHARRATEAQLAAAEAMSAALVRDVLARSPATRSVRLGEIANYINGRAFKPSDWEPTGTPIVRIQNLTSPRTPHNFYTGDVAPRHRITDGDLLVAWSASLGVYIWERGPAILNQHIFKVEEDPALINRHYMYYALQVVMNRLKAQAHGATMQHVTKPRFEATPIPLPPPDEQRRIVEDLERQTAAAALARRAAEAQLATAEALPAAILRRAFREAA